MDYTKEDIYSIDLTDLTAGGYEVGYGPTPPSVTIDSGIFTTHPAWTTTGTSGSWILDNTTMTDTRPSGRIRLEGEDADIEINGRSLMQILDSIEQRLGLVRYQEDLEKDWHELKELGDRYREKVKHIEEKVKIWDALKR